MTWGMQRNPDRRWWQIWRPRWIAMIDQTLDALSRSADCPIKLRRVGEDVRVSWSVEPLDFIDLSPKQLDQLAQCVAEVRK